MSYPEGGSFGISLPNAQRSRFCLQTLARSYWRPREKLIEKSWEAAKKGWLSVLKWLRGQGCPWDNRVFIAAARKRHMHILRFAKDNGCSYDSGSIIQGACESGAIRVGVGRRVG